MWLKKVLRIFSGTTLIALFLTGIVSGMDLNVGNSHLEVSRSQIGKLQYSFRDNEIISGGKLRIEKQNKKIPLDKAEYSSRSLWEGIENTWKLRLAKGEIKRRILLGSNYLKINWEIDLKDKETKGVLNLYIPEKALGQVPFTIKYHTGQTEKDKLWVEPRGVVVGMKEMVFHKPEGDVIFSFPGQKGWRFEDLRRKMKGRPFAFSLPLINLGNKQNIEFRRHSNSSHGTNKPSTRFENPFYLSQSLLGVFHVV